MLKILESKKTVQEAAKALEVAIPKHGFGLLQSYDLKAKIIEKGIDFTNECRIFEVCNQRFAAEVLGNDMSMAMALPCRIAVYEQDGHTEIGTILPTALLKMFSGSPKSQRVAEQVESVLLSIMEESV